MSIKIRISSTIFIPEWGEKILLLKQKNNKLISLYLYKLRRTLTTINHKLPRFLLILFKENTYYVIGYEFRT